MAWGSYYKTAKFDTLEGVDYFQRQLDSFGVRYNPSLEVSSEGLYCLRYDKWELDREMELFYGVDNRVELVEDLFM